jgi:hypothetical protein
MSVMVRKWDESLPKALGGLLRSSRLNCAFFCLSYLLEFANVAFGQVVLGLINDRVNEDAPCTLARAPHKIGELPLSRDCRSHSLIDAGAV